MKADFLRSFLIFVNEDAGYGSAQKPTGHVRIEVREGKGRLHASVQNLLESGRFCYRLYLIETATGRFNPVYAGLLDLRKNRAELEWEFDPLDVGGSGRSIGDFGIAAVLVDYGDRENTSVICPLAAYKGGKQVWRSSVKDHLYIKRPSQEDLHKEEITSKYEGVFESKYIPPETEPSFNINQYDRVNAGGPLSAEMAAISVENIGQTPGNTSGIEPVAEQEQREQPKLPEEAEPEQNEWNEQQEQSGQTAEERHEWQVQVEQPEQPPEQQQEQYIRQEQPPEQQQEQYISQEQPIGNSTGFNANCVYFNGSMCGAYVNPGAANPCSSCVMHNRHENAGEMAPTNDMEKLRAEFENNFERFDPFHIKRSDYTWWKVANPVNLNNILYQCNIRSPLLFNPAVMISHYKYRHLIVGIYTDRARDREYVVCGIFGMHMVDRKPFGDMCKWVQTEGTRPKYGAFGYWIVYLDPATGKILNIR